MCDVVTGLAVASLVIGAGTAAMSYDEQRRAANTQADNAREQLARDTEALNARAEEERQAAQGQMSERHRQAIIERGRIRAAAGESGLYDNGRIEAESFFNEGMDIASIVNNNQTTQKQIARGKEAAYGNAQSILNQSRGPNPFAAGLQVAGAGISTYAGYRKTNPSKIKSTEGDF